MINSMYMLQFMIMFYNDNLSRRINAGGGAGWGWGVNVQFCVNVWQLFRVLFFTRWSISQSNQYENTMNVMFEHGRGEQHLQTTAAVGHHVFVLLEDDIVVVVVVEKWQGQKSVGHAAGLTDVDQVHLADDALHSGVVRRSLVLTQRERASTTTSVSVVTCNNSRFELAKVWLLWLERIDGTFGRNDPGRPTDFVEIDVHVDERTLSLWCRRALLASHNVLHVVLSWWPFASRVPYLKKKKLIPKCYHFRSSNLY